MCYVIVYSYQLLVGSSYTVISYHDNYFENFFWSGYVISVKNHLLEKIAS